MSNLAEPNRHEWISGPVYGNPRTGAILVDIPASAARLNVPWSEANARLVAFRCLAMLRAEVGEQLFIAKMQGIGH